MKKQMMAVTVAFASLTVSLTFMNTQYNNKLMAAAVIASKQDASAPAPVQRNLYEKLRDGNTAMHTLIIGDSIGQGAGVSKSSEQWFTRFTDHLYKAHHIVNFTQNISVGGTTVLGGWTDYNRLREFGNDPVDLAFICFGQNDQVFLPIEEYANIYEELIRELKAERANPEIVLLIENPIQDMAYPSVVKKLAEKYGLSVVDARTLFQQSGLTPKDLTIDDVHPNAAGQEIYADEAIRIIESNAQAGKAIAFDPSSERLFAGSKDFTQFHQVETRDTAFSFDGSFLAVQFYQMPKSGNVNVYVDDKLAKTISLQIPGTVVNTKLIDDKLASGAHTVRMESDRPVAIRGYVTRQ